MPANLDKALDEIIDSHKKQPKRASSKHGPRKVSKNINASRRRAPIPVGIKRGVISQEKAASVLETAYVTKVNVEGLPRDIKEDAVRDFFKTSVGGLQRVLLSYNERGNSTGMATLTFASAEKAREAVKKFNGAPIDGGKSKLRLNLIVDPSRRPLSARITPVNVGRDRPLIAVPKNGRPLKRDTRAPTKKAALAKAAKAEKRKQKPQKKSLEQLDQEMADYFDESGK